MCRIKTCWVSDGSLGVLPATLGSRGVQSGGHGGGIITDGGGGGTCRMFLVPHTSRFRLSRMICGIRSHIQVREREAKANFKYIYTRIFFEKTTIENKKMQQTVTDRVQYSNCKNWFFAWTYLGGGYVRAAGGKIVNFNMDSCINLSGLIWMSVIRSGSTNHRRPVLNLALKKNILTDGAGGKGIGERDRRERRKKRNFILHIYPTLQTRIWNCLKVKSGQNWTYLGLLLYYWYGILVWWGYIGKFSCKFILHFRKQLFANVSFRMKIHYLRLKTTTYFY